MDGRSQKYDDEPHVDYGGHCEDVLAMVECWQLRRKSFKCYFKLINWLKWGLTHGYICGTHCRCAVQIIVCAAPTCGWAPKSAVPIHQLHNHNIFGEAQWTKINTKIINNYFGMLKTISFAVPFIRLASRRDAAAINDSDIREKCNDISEVSST